MVQHKHTKTLFALKYINKAKCVKMKAVANIVQERRLLEEVGHVHRKGDAALMGNQIDHPFVVNLRYAFQDDENCFFVLDLMLGGDLRCKSTRHDSMLTHHSSPRSSWSDERGNGQVLHCRDSISSGLSASEENSAQVSTDLDVDQALC